MVTFCEDATPPPQVSRVYQFISDEGIQEWIPTANPSAADCSASELKLITWNINAGARLLKERLTRVITHLRMKVFDNKNTPPPCCILLQEVHEDVLPELLRCSWIRNNFLVTPISSENWKIPHGVVTLVSKVVPVSTVFVMELPVTSVGRQALFVDVHLSAPPTETEDAARDARIRTIRIANTHLETKPNANTTRPKQLRKIAQMLNVSNIDASICAGSMCAVSNEDKTAPSQAGFADAYKGWKTDCATWGNQPRIDEFPPGRLDKILYFPSERVEITCPLRIGVKLAMLARNMYVSDHCGLVASVRVLRAPDD